MRRTVHAFLFPGALQVELVLTGCFPNKQMGDVVSRKEASLMTMGFQHEEVVLFIEEIEQ